MGNSVTCPGNIEMDRDRSSPSTILMDSSMRLTGVASDTDDTQSEWQASGFRSGWWRGKCISREQQQHKLAMAALVMRWPLMVCTDMG